MTAMWGVLSSAILYMLAVALYMAMIGRAEVDFFTSETLYMRSQGYWQGICGSVLYFFSSMCLFVSFFSRPSVKAGLRAHELEISRRQRRLMLLYILFIGWLAMSAAVAGKLMHLTYADGTYYCIVTALTLGYGDIVAKTDVPRGLTVVFLYVALVLGGLTTLALFQAFFGNSRRESLSRGVSRKRLDASLKNPHFTEEESFNKMRQIVQKTEVSSGIFRSALTLAWLSIFWLVGALIFCKSEGWSYFQAFYYCAISLASVGFGDFVVKSNGGRSFFILWALFSVPTMAASISDLASLVMTLVEGHIGNDENREDEHEEQYQIIIGDHTPLAGRGPQAALWHHLVDIIKDHDSQEYPFSVWHAVIATVLQTDTLPQNFWLSDDSPIQVPFLSEKRFILLAILHTMKVSTEKAFVGSLGSSLMRRNAFTPRTTTSRSDTIV